MAKTLADILQEKGIQLEQRYGGEPPADLVDREIKKEPTPRAKKLRDLYYQTYSSANMEFPYWYTRVYEQNQHEIPVVRRAMSLKAAFSHLTPMIFPGEKLVMGKTYNYRGSFPMPWLSEGYFMAREDEFYQEALKKGSTSIDELVKWGQGGGNVTKSFGKVVSIAGKFGMRQEEVPAMLKVANWWYGKSVEDISARYERMVPEYDVKEKVMRSCICMFDSGFTLPQGREVINYYYPLQYGFDGLIKMCEEKSAEVAGESGGDGVRGMDRLYFYQAAKLALEGVQNWILNYAKEARRLVEVTEEPVQKKEYQEIAEVLEHIAHKPPETFRQALQLTYTIHISVLNEDAISGMSPGRVGQVLFPYFEQDIEAGRITEDEVLELLELHRVKFTCIDCFASMGVVGGVLSGNTFNNLSMGGLQKDGTSAANRLEMLILEAGITCGTPQPTLSILYDEKLPEEFLLKAIECVKTGTGYPAFMNNRGAMEFMMSQYGGEGMTLEEARAWAVGGCLESSPGAWKPLTLRGKTYWVPGGAGQPTSVGVHFISLPKVLECVLFNGKDLRTGLQVYAPHNRTLDSYEAVWETFKDYFAQTVNSLNKCNNIQHDIWRKNNMAVFHSVTKPDTLDRGHHIGDMGYRYNATFNVESTGTANLINSLAAIKLLVFKEKKYTIDQMIDAIKNNFGFKTAEEVGSFSLISQEKREGGQVYDDIHGDCLMAPKYGNDIPLVDSILKEWEEYFCGMCHNYLSLYGKELYACQISVSTHAPQGAATLATADGRLQGTTFADASMSPYPGTDTEGPYALFNSATVWDHSLSQNSQLNMKVHPTAVTGLEGARKLLDLTRAYMRKGGFHVQYNIVDSRVLRSAQENPDEYRDLMVRVAGFTQYWVEIGKAIQDEVIARTEYERV